MEMSATTQQASAVDVGRQVPAGSGRGRRIVFDQSAQRVWLVGSDGNVERSYLVSGSRHDNVSPGTYEVSSRTRVATSYTGSGTLEYFVRFTHGPNAPIGFHAITVRADGSPAYSKDQLGVARTPGCVEATRGDAKALWAFAPVGTAVVVTA